MARTNIRRGVAVDLILLVLLCTLGECHSQLVQEDTSTATAAAPEAILKTTPLVEALRRIAPLQEHKLFNNLDAVTGDTNGDGQGDIAFCHLVDLNIYGSFFGPFLEFALEAMAAMNLAAEHLNTGNGVIVSEVEGLDKRCKIRFTTEHVDTKGTADVAVDNVISIVQRKPEDVANKPLPCAFLGAFLSAESVATALLTSLKGYPQFSAISTATELDDKKTFPLFGRVIPPSASYSGPLMDYMTTILGVKHMAVLHSDIVNDVDYVRGMRETILAEYPNFAMEAVSFSATTLTKSPSDYTAAIKAVKQTGFRYIFVTAALIDEFPIFLEEAYNQGIIGDGLHTWIINSKSTLSVYLYNQEHVADSILAKVGGGILAFGLQPTRDLPDYAPYHNYAKAWKNLANNQQDLDYLNTKLPSHLTNPSGAPLINSDTFSAGYITATAPHYDIVIAFGLAACNAINQTGLSLTGQDHYAHMLNSSFNGATGPIVFDPDTGSRIPRSMLYDFSNAVPMLLDNGNITFVEVETHYFADKWIAKQAVIFNDNTTNIPKDLPVQDVNDNHVGTALRSVGLVMAALVVILSIGFGLWAYAARDSRIVRASQPIFLYILCWGTFLMGVSIIPKSLDDSIVSDSGADWACTIFPWFLALGWCFSFSALFSKTYRINQIFHNPGFKRVKIEAQDVVIPMFAMLACNILILSLWTALDPLLYERQVINYDQFGRPSETQGLCICENWYFYLAPLGIVNFGALAVAMHQAWIARKLSVEFAESEWIARVMNTILVVSFLGGPVLVISYDDPQSFYFIFSALIFIVCQSLLCFIFIPKMASQEGSKSGTMSSMRNISNAITTSVGRSADSNAMRVTNHSQMSGTSSFDSISGSLQEGTRILVHPKLQDDMKQEIRLLKREQTRLRDKITELQSGSISGVSLASEGLSQGGLEVHDLLEEVQQLNNDKKALEQRIGDLVRGQKAPLEESVGGDRED